MRKPIHIEIAMPSGPAQYWAAMQAAGPKGFTIRHIANCAAGVAYDTVKRYVWFCVQQGYVAKIGTKRDGYALQTRYAVVKRLSKAPIERADPQRAPLTAREAMWNAMRTLAQFTVKELRLCASTEERPISTRSANLYVQRLRDAGALVVIEEPRRARGRKNAAPCGAESGVYKLSPRANSGPLAPKLCVAGFVFDMNRRAVVGEAIVKEAAQ